MPSPGLTGGRGPWLLPNCFSCIAGLSRASEGTTRKSTNRPEPYPGSSRASISTVVAQWNSPFVLSLSINEPPMWHAREVERAP